MVRVTDLDQRVEAAKAAGAEVALAPTSYPYGERQCSIVDLGGHV
jgi:uncharacterized glyoxalase superfamily protein PhnB